MRRDLIVGDFVKYDRPGGSTGKVTTIHNDMVYVEWAYGILHGKIDTAISGFCRKSGGWRDNTQCLTLITEEEYNQIATGQWPGKGQHDQKGNDS